MGGEVSPLLAYFMRSKLTPRAPVTRQNTAILCVGADKRLNNDSLEQRSDMVFTAKMQKISSRADSGILRVDLVVIEIIKLLESAGFIFHYIHVDATLLVEVNGICGRYDCKG